MSHESANYYPDSDEKETLFDLLKRDEMRSGRRGWTAKAETLEAETSKAETSKALNVKTLKTLKMEASSKAAKAEASEGEANIETTTSIATTSILNKMTCHWCWKLHSDRKSLIPHLKLCEGKCQGCKGLGVPCIFLNGMSQQL